MAISRTPQIPPLHRQNSRIVTCKAKAKLDIIAEQFTLIKLKNHKTQQIKHFMRLQ